MTQAFNTIERLIGDLTEEETLSLFLTLLDHLTMEQLEENGQIISKKIAGFEEY